MISGTEEPEARSLDDGVVQLVRSTSRRRLSEHGHAIAGKVRRIRAERVRAHPPRRQHEIDVRPGLPGRKQISIRIDEDELDDVSATRRADVTTTYADGSPTRKRRPRRRSASRCSPSDGAPSRAVPCSRTDYSRAGLQRSVVASHVLHHPVSPGHNLLDDRLDISIDERPEDAGMPVSESVTVRVVDAHPGETRRCGRDRRSTRAASPRRS